MIVKSNRVQEEAMILATVYGTVNYDNGACTWLHIPRFPLPAIWSQPVTELLILIPDQYPFVPPDSFGLCEGLRTIDGARPGHYFEGAEHNPLHSAGWAFFCLHVRGKWRPSARVMEGDNLFKYVELIRGVLSNPPRR